MDESALRPCSQRQMASEFRALQIVSYDNELDWLSTRFMPYPHLLFWPAHLGRYRAYSAATRHSWMAAGIVDRPHWSIFISGDCGRIILIYVFTIAVGTFDPVLRLRYLQPDPGVAQRIITAVAGKALFICRLCFWHLCWHRSALLVGCARQRTPVRATVAGQPWHKRPS